MGQDYEKRAMDTAHNIVMQQGLQLALSAQNLDKRNTSMNRLRLIDAIRESLLEARCRSSDEPRISQ